MASELGLGEVATRGRRAPPPPSAEELVWSASVGAGVASEGIRSGGSPILTLTPFCLFFFFFLLITFGTVAFDKMPASESDDDAGGRGDVAACVDPKKLTLSGCRAPRSEPRDVSASTPPGEADMETNADNDKHNARAVSSFFFLPFFLQKFSAGRALAMRCRVAHVQRSWVRVRFPRILPIF